MASINDVIQYAIRTLKTAGEIVRKSYDMFYNPNPLDVQTEVYDENGNLITATLPNRAKIHQDYENWRANVRKEYPFINILKNSNMLDVDGDGVLDSPLAVSVSGDYSIVESVVLPWNDPSVPPALTQALLDIGVIYKDSDGNLSQCCKVPFNVHKFVFSGTDYTSGHALLIAFNPVAGHFTFGALAVLSTTGNIKIQGFGELEAGRVYTDVVFETKLYWGWHVDTPTVKVKGTADIWIVGPWFVPGKFADSPGENKGHPLFTYGAIYKL